jgi:hypothetical protein
MARTMEIPDVLAIFYSNVTTVVIERIKGQLEDPTHPAIAVPGFRAGYTFRSTEASELLLEQLRECREQCWTEEERAMLQKAMEIRDGMSGEDEPFTGL